MAKKIKQIEMKVPMRLNKKVTKKKAKKSVKPVVIFIIAGLMLLGISAFIIVKMMQS